MRSVWDNIDDPKYRDGENSLRLPYIYPGKFRLQVDKISHYPSKKNPREEWFRVDFTILEGAKNGVDRVAWVVNLTKNDYGLRDIVAFVSALMGEETAINRATMEQLEGPQQPAAGLIVDCEAYNKKTESGGDFTQVSWKAVD